MTDTHQVPEDYRIFWWVDENDNLNTGWHFLYTHIDGDESGDGPFATYDMALDAARRDAAEIAEIN